MTPRWEADDDIYGIRVLDVLETAKDFNKSVYLIRCGCGHETTITGNALTQRRSNLRRRRGTNLCHGCAVKLNLGKGRKKGKTARKPKPMTPPVKKTAMKPLDALRLMAFSRDRQ